MGPTTALLLATQAVVQRDINLNRIAEQVNQYLSGCVPVDEKYGTYNKQKGKRMEKETKEKNQEKKNKNTTKKDGGWLIF